MAETSDSWLVRTSGNEVLGPYSKETLISQIRDGVLGPQDEVCGANHYWIYLDEREEVSKQLGIEMPRSSIGDQEEVTSTDTQTLRKDAAQAPRSADLGAGSGGGDSESAEAQGRTLKRADARPTRPDRRQWHSTGEIKPIILGSVERPSFWRVVISILIVLTGVLVAWVIRVLQTSK